MLALLYSNNFGTHLAPIHFDSATAALDWLNANALHNLIMDSALLVDQTPAIVARFVCDQNEKHEYLWRVSSDRRGMS